jgi:hypothetical protein
MKTRVPRKEMLDVCTAASRTADREALKIGDFLLRYRGLTIAIEKVREFAKTTELIPRKELRQLIAMADEMANCTDYMVRDKDGCVVGRDPKIDRAITKVRSFFKL